MTNARQGFDVRPTPVSILSPPSIFGLTKTDKKFLDRWLKQKNFQHYSTVKSFEEMIAYQKNLRQGLLATDMFKSVHVSAVESGSSQQDALDGNGVEIVVKCQEKSLISAEIGVNMTPTKTRVYKIILEQK